MKVAVFAAYPISTPHFETQLEIIQKHLDQGDVVTLLVCDGQMPACDVNPHHQRYRCLKCCARRVEGLKLLSHAVHLLPMENLTPQQLRPVQFTDVQALKDFRVDNFDIGMGVLSSLISMTRDPEVDLAAHERVLAALLRAAWSNYYSMRNHLAAQSWDRVYVYNGRYAPLRAVLRACQHVGVACTVHEKGSHYNSYALYDNTMPHDRAYCDLMMRKLWREADPVQRVEIASRWYRERANAIDQGEPSFVKQQEKNLLPADWDERRHNVAVFLSSEDEFVAVGQDWVNPLYASQIDGVHALLRSLQEDPGQVHLYLRVHPNLAGVDNAQTRSLAQLRSPCLTVIPAEDPVSTYALMRRANKVLSFGSTAGIEAVYWQVPSILAGMSFYRDLGATYNPKSHPELVQLLKADLAPKDQQLALIYGYFKSQFGVPFQYYRSQALFDGRFKGVRVRPTLLKRLHIGTVRELERLLHRSRAA